MPRPLAEIEEILSRERTLRRDLGGRVLRNLCMQCELAQCNTASSGCKARQLRNARGRASYRRHRATVKRKRREHYQAHREREIARVLAYQRDPDVRALKKLKHAMRNIESCP